MRSSSGAAGCLLVAATSLGLAQQPQFRAVVTEVEVDVSVTDGDGNFVRGLGPDDFEILEDGQPQTLSAFSVVDIPVATPASVKDALAAAGDVTSNAEAAGGRLWVMLLDMPTSGGVSEGTQAMRAMQTQNVARRFVEEAMAPGDSMAVIHVQGTTRQAQALTRDKRLLLDSIERFGMGVGSVMPQTGPEAVARIVSLFRLIEDLSARLGAITSRRTAVLWFGGGIPFNLAEAANTLPSWYNDAIRTAQRNNVAIYPIDPGGLGGTPGIRIFPAALRAVAEDTGGEAIVSTNEFIRGFSRIVRDNSSYYLLGYSPRVAHVDGKFHSITVRVRRPGVRVRARRGYLAPERDAAERSRAAAAALPPVIDALRSPIPRTGLEVQVTLAPFRATRGGTVVLGASVSGEAIRGDESAADIAYRVINTDGKVILERSGNRPIAPTAQRSTSADSPPGFAFHFSDRFEVPRGRYEIRFGARVRDDDIGTVVAYVEVPDFQNRPLALSGLLVGARAVGQAGADVPVSSLAERQFRATQTLNVTGALYARRNVQIDRVVVDVTVRDAEGKTVFATSNEASGLPPDDLKDRRFSVDVPLSQLTPGKHVLNVKAYVRGNERNATTRDVTFSIAN